VLDDSSRFINLRCSDFSNFLFMKELILKLLKCRLSDNALKVAKFKCVMQVTA